jgi:outer membrane protein assembly factor BamB
MNYTDQWFYTVEKATTEIRLYLNGSESDKTYNLTQIANITAELNVSQKTIFLYSNMSGWVLQSSPTPLINYTTLKEKGTFNITAYFEGDENYTVSSKTRYLTVNDVKAPKYASTYQNASWVGVGHAIMLSANWTDDYDLDYAWLETNETGEWQKKQEVDINLTQGQTLANFSWSNSSIPAGRIIGWRIYANDTSGNTNTTEIMTFAVNASEVWRHATLGFIYSSPAVGDVNNDGNIDVVFASYDKNLYALTGYNGTRIFNFTTNGSIASSPSLSSISNSNYLYIFIASYDGNMYAVNGSDGKKIWNFSTQGLIYSSPALYDINSDGKLEIIFGSYDKNVYALDAETGVKIWNYSTGGKIASSPAVVNMNGDVLIVFGSYDNKLYALNSTGNLLWQFEAGDKIESSPAIDDVNSDGIYEIAFGSYDNKTYLLNASNGQLIWSYPTNNWITSSPVIANIGGSKKVIIASHDSNVYCFNANGSINWTFAIPTGGRIQSSPSIADVDLDGVNDVILGSSDSRLYALSGLTGKPIWHYKVNAYIFSSPTIADINGDGNLDFLFGSLDKNQYALDPPAWLLFGGNERRTRIFDATPPENVYFEINNETRQIASLWQEKFSNLAYAIITENSTGQVIQHAVRLKGMQDWVNLSFYTRGFYFNIQVFDEYNNSNIIEGFIEGERDTKPPVWLGNSSSTFVYQPNAVYEFLINWTDDSGVELSILEHNFTGTRMNESISSSYTIKDLPAGVYSWKSYARDYAGNWNETDEFYLIIEKSPGSVDLIANNSTYPNNVSVVCFGSMLFRNSSILSSLSDFSRLPSGAWNYTCFKDEEKNYTSAAKETIILVNKGLPMLNLSVSAGDKCPTVVNVKAFESNEGDSDIIYKLSNGTNEFYGSNISLTYRVLSGSYSFNYSSSLGMNWSSSFIARTIFVNDTTKPRNIYHKTLIQNNTVILSSTWEDKCSKISKGIITENSLGFYRNHTVSADKNQINYTFDVSDLRDRRGCRIFVGFICLKIVSYRITALDDFNNSNSVSGTFYYWFFLR